MTIGWTTYATPFPRVQALSLSLQDLTKSNVHPMGGQAYLSLENNEEPFLHGIKFTAMPPSKRFREMEQLSGGEKVPTQSQHPVWCTALACDVPSEKAPTQSCSQCMLFGLVALACDIPSEMANASWSCP